MKREHEREQVEGAEELVEGLRRAGPGVRAVTIGDKVKGMEERLVKGGGVKSSPLVRMKKKLER